MTTQKYESIEKLSKVGIWELLKKYSELDESNNILFISAYGFRDLIDDIMTEEDEFEEDIIFRLKVGLGNLYDELLECKTLFVNFIYEDQNEYAEESIQAP